MTSDSQFASVYMVQRTPFGEKSRVGTRPGPYQGQINELVDRFGFPIATYRLYSRRFFLSVGVGDQ